MTCYTFPVRRKPALGWTPRGLPLAERIRLSVTIDSSSGCWLWQKATRGTRIDYRYGEMTVNGRGMSAHRAAWIAFRGALPKRRGYHGACVLHACDRPLCVNPDHLKLGTHADNMADMVKKARAGRRDFNAGSSHGMARLTEAQVLRIRRLSADGWTGRRIARRYRLGEATVSQILTRQRWKHV